MFGAAVKKRYTNIMISCQYHPIIHAIGHRPLIPHRTVR